jgi:hypothetical protein
MSGQCTQITSKGCSTEIAKPGSQRHVFLAAMLVVAATSLTMITSGCGNKGQTSTAEASVGGGSVQPRTPESRTSESKSVDPKVQAEIQKAEAEKRAQLLKDAQAALDETRAALDALNKGDQKAALAALERVSGKLDVIVARDPRLALAPVGVTTVIRDLYASVDTVKAAVKQAKADLSSNRVQEARTLLEDLASQAEIHTTEIPLATYPAAIRSVAPLIDAGKTEDAKAALSTALNTLVVETLIVPLPQVRADVMLTEAQNLAAKGNLTDADKTRLRGLIESARTEIQLAETLGYGTKDDFKPLYAQIDDVRKKADAGESGRGLFDKLKQSVKNFKFV